MKQRLIHHLIYPADVDRELIPLLDVLNSIPGVRTRYSCCGHGYSEFYILLSAACDEAARAVIKKFDEFGLFVDYDGLFGKNPLLASYERDLRVGSQDVGTMNTRERKSFITKLRNAIEELVPINDW